MAKELSHYGMPRRSGRYPWGSGEDPYQRAVGWRGHYKNLKTQGLSDVDIAKGEGISTTQLRARNSITKNEIRAAQTAEVLRLSERGYSNMEIGRRMGINESVVRSLKDASIAERASITTVTANMLKEHVDKKRYIDIGTGVENYIGVKRTTLNTAVMELQEQGYKVHKVNVKQVGMPDQFTIVKILGAPDTEWKEVVNDISLIQNITSKSDDYGRSFSDLGLKPIQSVSSDRIKVRYAEEGGSDKDGVIELRRGVADLDMGGSKYAQVRIGVDGTHYLKGMAIYSDDLPDGVDVVFNTNKSDTGNKLNAMKKMKTDKDGNIDKDNPFGSTLKREPGEDGADVWAQRGALNIVYEEGDWDTWSRTLSSQFLSKQTVPLAKNQLDLGFKQKQEEYEEIVALTNPVVKKQLLLAFADDCDSSAVHLKAAGLPRQASKVILPLPDIKPTEVYAPTFKDGETVVLIRHPHGGIFEIPQLVVNNKSKSGKRIIGPDAPDAIGIHPDVAKKMSGADFDGDTAIVIPNPLGLIKSSASLKGLENFDPITSYPPYDGMRTIDGGTYNATKREVDYGGSRPKTQTKQTKMGEISNLITDMTIKGATLDELARAVRHSMVVIDSEKHHLNYKLSYEQNGIAALAEKYQNSKRGGASTIISRAGSQKRIAQRKEGAAIGPISTKTGRPSVLYIDPHTGEKVYTLTGASYVDSKGRVVEKQTLSTQMAEEKDPFKLSSGRQIELVYAGYANDLKSLANTARLEAINTEPTPYSPSAKLTYANEVASLNAKLNIALKNKPLERQAQILANTIVDRKQEANPDMDYEDLKKTRNQALAESRVRTGASKIMVEITEREWEAIQSGAISTNKLTSILQNTKLERIKELATPRSTSAMSQTQIARARLMINSGATLADVADALGVSTTTISRELS